jgi:hypothetical protein
MQTHPRGFPFVRVALSATQAYKIPGMKRFTFFAVFLENYHKNHRFTQISP